MHIAEKPGKGTVFSIDYTDWHQSLKMLLEKSGLADRLQDRQRILIKPNLVEAMKPPITTPVALVGSLVDLLRQMAPHCAIMIGEGCGSAQYDTWHVFKQLGYAALAADRKIELLDLNEESCVVRENNKFPRLPKIYLPAVLFDSFLLSVPVLKAHSLAEVTLTMKNMMGAAPPTHYQQGGHWKKASFHDGIHAAIFDLNRYRTPDFTILDATVGMAEAHLWGPVCRPARNKLAAGFDPVAIDAWGATLLGRDWRKIGHIRLADGVLGSGEFTEVRC
ncbi:MAG: DUF362 domain-containing protein [Desulfurivibrio sp.]|nr:MAG: DUF362 domain-containing protein [Desulfurivibrio sp.]